jgi:hypothetical protein
MNVEPLSTGQPGKGGLRVGVGAGEFVGAVGAPEGKLGKAPPALGTSVLLFPGGIGIVGIIVIVGRIRGGVVVNDGNTV